jgi:hypothetical protein
MARLKRKQTAELEFFDEQCGIEIQLLKQERKTARKVIENKAKKIEGREMAVHDAERIWNAAQGERLAQITAGQDTLPSSHIRYEEVAKTEGGFLVLPRLRLESDKSPRVSRRQTRDNVS